MAKDAEKLAAQAQRIGELRAAKRVTQPDVADAVGVTLRAYQAWEAGDGGVGPQNIKKLAAYFGTTPDYIEYGTTPRTSTPDLMAEISAGATTAEQLAEVNSRLNRLQAVLEELAGEKIVAAALEALARAEQPGAAARPRRAA